MLPKLVEVQESIMVNTIELNNYDSFWREQFGESGSYNQAFFDVLNGVLLPICCLGLDPVVFHSSGYGVSFLFAYKPFFYIALPLQMLLLMFWLSFPSFPYFFSGAFFCRYFAVAWYWSRYSPSNSYGSFSHNRLIGICTFPNRIRLRTQHNSRFVDAQGTR